MPILFVNVTVREFIHLLSSLDGSWAQDNCFNPEGDIPYNQSEPFLLHGYSEKDTQTPVEAYWK